MLVLAEKSPQVFVIAGAAKEQQHGNWKPRIHASVFADTGRDDNINREKTVCRRQPDEIGAGDSSRDEKWARESREHDCSRVNVCFIRLLRYCVRWEILDRSESLTMIEFLKIAASRHFSPVAILISFSFPRSPRLLIFYETPYTQT